MSCLGFYPKTNECVRFFIEFILRKFRGSKQKEVFLPPELIAEILSWLPVKSILRLKCVCRTWLSIAEDREFIDKQMRHVPSYFWAFEEGNGHLIRDICRGLILEKMGPDSNYRLRNPSTKRALDLPHHDERDAYHAMLCYISSTKTFKVVFPFANGKLNGRGSFKILTVDDNDEWRMVDFPSASNLERVRWSVNFVGGVYVFDILPQIESEQRKREIVMLEVESEKVWRMSVPQRAGLSSNWSLMSWAGKPSFYQRLVEDGNEILHVWVVEDCKKQKWAEEMIVVDLTPMKGHNGYYIPYSFYGNKIYMHCSNKKYLSFDIVSKVVTHVKSPEVPAKKWQGRTSLMEIKGMKPCS